MSFIHRQLTAADISASIELQQGILDTLPADQTILHVKSKHDFAAASDGIHSKMHGIFTDDNRLIAQCIIRLSRDETIPASPMFSDIIGSGRGMTVFEGVLVHPDFRGHKLMHEMLEKACDILGEDGHRGISACIDWKNSRSFVNFLHKDMVISSAYIDPADNGKTFGVYHLFGHTRRSCRAIPTTHCNTT